MLQQCNTRSGNGDALWHPFCNSGIRLRTNCFGHSDHPGTSQIKECAAMRIRNLYEDANGESHFRDIEVDWVEETPSGKMSKRLPATGIVFRETTTDYENSWHRAPRRQYVISLAGGITITASDGETRHIGAGEIVLVEDTTGKGHITKSSGDKPRHTIFVPID